MKNYGCLDLRFESKHCQTFLPTTEVNLKLKLKRRTSTSEKIIRVVILGHLRSKSPKILTKVKFQYSIMLDKLSIKMTLLT